MRESQYQASLVRRLEATFIGCLVVRMDASRIQGIPDLLILFGNRWAGLEVKIDETSRVQPNQRYHIEHLHSMSYCSFIYPQNEDEVFHELQLTFSN